MTPLSKQFISTTISLIPLIIVFDYQVPLAAAIWGYGNLFISHNLYKNHNKKTKQKNKVTSKSIKDARHVAKSLNETIRLCHPRYIYGPNWKKHLPVVIHSNQIKQQSTKQKNK